MKNLIIIGSSGHAKVVIDMAEKTMLYNIIGLIDDYKTIGTQTSGHKVIGTISDIGKLNSSDTYFFIAVGNNWSRYMIYNRLSELGLKYVSIIHPSAVIARDITIPKGVAVMANAVINSGTYIGDFAIVNTGAIIEHDNVLQDFASVSPRVVTGGNVHIGKFSFIGIGSIIKNTVTIGEHTVIGAGSTVLDFTEGYKVAYGIPCKPVYDRKKDDKYL